MDAGQAPARQARGQPRHELRSLTYVTLDQANGGIVRNLNDQGIAVQAVAAVREGKQLLVRFELRGPKLSVAARGEVVWGNASGQCGIRFLDPPPELTHHINEWIFGSLLEGVALHSVQAGSIFAGSSVAAAISGRPALVEDLPTVDERDSSLEDFDDEESPEAVDEDDGLIVSATPRNVIELPPRPEPTAPVPIREETLPSLAAQPGEADWLSQPLSGRTLAWTVNTLVVVAALLLFTLVFLTVARELPRWPMAAMAGAAILVSTFYWGFCKVVTGATFGAKLARIADREEEEQEREARFR